MFVEKLAFDRRSESIGINNEHSISLWIVRRIFVNLVHRSPVKFEFFSRNQRWMSHQSSKSRAENLNCLFRDGKEDG